MPKWIPLAFTAVLCSCEKYSDDTIVPDSKHYSDVERVVDMHVPTDFDWSTEQEIVLTLKSAVSQRVQCVDADGQVIQKLWLAAGQAMEIKVVVPAYQTKITDGDGVPDDDDDYPNDAARAFNNYFPSSGPGTLMFEDLWPYKGDYDFNDVVVDYRFTTVTNAQNFVVETMADFTLRASGAGYENGFGFQLSSNTTLAPSDIAVSGMQLNSGAIQVDANGLEIGQTIPTVIVFDNFFDLMTRPRGIGVNTQAGRPFVPHAQVAVLMSYTPSTFSLLDLKIEDFNPFIYINQDRSKEVHLPNHPPTDLANSALLGTGEDDSQVGSQRYYQTEDNLPWALNILESIPYPLEKTDIILAYPQFDNWAQSGGLQFRDWYVNQANNRVEQHLY